MANPSQLTTPPESPAKPLPSIEAAAAAADDDPEPIKGMEVEPAAVAPEAAEFLPFFPKAEVAAEEAAEAEPSLPAPRFPGPEP